MDDPTVSITDGPQGPAGNLRAWGPFRMMEKLGQGAFGEVYKAWDPTLEREVALKILLNTGRGDDYKSILREARAVAKVRHPNIVSVYGVDRHDGRVGFWSEFVHGKTISALLDSQGPFSPTETALIGMELCRAVSAVHAAGLLHRDIKASNAMREEGGRIRLLDFGLSHEHGAAAQWGGTMQYMAPELRAGRSPSVASDIYALGILLYHMATGGYPADPDSTTTSDLMDRRPDLPSSFVRAVDTATEFEPSKRYQSAGAMLQALSGTMGGSSAEVEARPRGRWRRWAIEAALAAAVLGGTAYFAKDWVKARAHGTSTANYELYTQAQELLVRYDKTGNTEKAIQLLQQAIEQQAHFPLAYAELGRAYWREYLSNSSDDSVVAKALDACKEAQRLDPKLARVQVTLGMIHVGTGKTALGMQELQEAERLDADDPDVQAALSNGYKATHRMDQAKAAMQKAMDLAPGDWRWPYLMASLDIDSGEFKKAEEHANQAISISPDNGLAYYNLGVAYQREARYGDAQKALEKSVEFTPTFWPLMALGITLTWEGQFERSAQTTQRAIQLSPKSYTAWGNLAVAYDRSPETKPKARETYRRAAELAEEARKTSPNNARLLVDLADYYANLNMPERSLPLLRQAAILAPDTPELLEHIAIGYENNHRRKEALEFITKALDRGLLAESVKHEQPLDGLRRDERAPAAIRDKN